MVIQKLRRIYILLILALVLTIAIPVLGEDTQVIDVTLTPNAVVDIVVSPDAWTHYEVLLGESNETSSTDFTLNNNGSIQITVAVAGTDTEGWSLETSPGHNTFAIDFKLDGSSNWSEIGTIPETFVGGLPHNEHKDFGLKIIMPISTDQTSKQDLVITFIGIAD